jgi:hypothetical protein
MTFNLLYRMAWDTQVQAKKSLATIKRFESIDELASGVEQVGAQLQGVAAQKLVWDEMKEKLDKEARVRLQDGSHRLGLQKQLAKLAPHHHEGKRVLDAYEGEQATIKELLARKAPSIAASKPNDQHTQH